MILRPSTLGALDRAGLGLVHELGIGDRVARRLARVELLDHGQDHEADDQPDSDVLEQVVQHSLLGARTAPGHGTGRPRYTSARIPQTCGQTLNSTARTGPANGARLSRRRQPPGPETFADDEHLAAAVPRRRGLADIRLREMPGNLALERVETLALESFDDEVAAGLQPGDGEFERKLARWMPRAWSTLSIPDRLGAMSDTTRSTGRSPRACSTPAEPLVGRKVRLDDGHAPQRRHVQEVDRDDRRARPELLREHLAPAARRRPEVHGAMPFRNRASRSSSCRSLNAARER